jgi:hypothetical protein
MGGWVDGNRVAAGFDPLGMLTLCKRNKLEKDLEGGPEKKS